jgi:xanthine/CO dehydrogenase XdhC/CoxF family maturation factor
MKHWKETEELLGRAIDLAAAGRSASLTTVVRILGSAYRRPGAKFLVEDDGRTMGSVSGGCLEADVRVHALEVARTGVPRLLHYDTGSDDRAVWGLGLGCNGSVDVFVQPACSADALAVFTPLRAALAGRSPVALTTILGGPFIGRSVLAGADGMLAPSVMDPDLLASTTALATQNLTARKSRVDRVGEVEIFTDTLVPPSSLVICGAGDDARPLAAYAADVGFRVTVVDHRPAYLSADRFPSSATLAELRPDDEGSAALPFGPQGACVVMTHSLGTDRGWLHRAVVGRAGYVGMLGPRERCARLLGEIGASAGDTVFGPVGLDIGADGAEQIAVSVVAEMLAVLSRRDARHLREKEQAIHAR